MILFNELNVPITDHEVRVELLRLKSRKASGHDNVTAEMLKASDSIAVTFFTKIFNKFFQRRALSRPIDSFCDCASF